MEPIKTITVEIPERILLRSKAVLALMKMEQREFIAQAMDEKCDKEIIQNNLSL